jgi:hypothetical protein
MQKYSDLIQTQGDEMRRNPRHMQTAYDQVAAEFAAEQRDFANDNLGDS